MIAKTDVKGENSFNPDLLLQAIDALVQLMENETQALKEGKVTKATDMLERKRDLVGYIASIRNTLRDNPQLKDGLAEEVRKKIRVAAEKLDVVAQENHKEALNAKIFNGMVIKALTKAVVENNKKGASYSRKGRCKKGSVPITLNREI
jgi:flagellar biosynthesis/type III secretory pathway chaperone